LVKNAEENQFLLAKVYMKLAEKNQGENFKKHSRFLKIFPQYFAMNVQSFYEDPEIEITTARRKIVPNRG
jgi:ribosomal protein S19